MASTGLYFALPFIGWMREAVGERKGEGGLEDKEAASPEGIVWDFGVVA